VSSRAARAVIQRIPVSKNQTPKTKNQKKKKKKKNKKKKKKKKPEKNTLTILLCNIPRIPTGLIFVPSLVLSKPQVCRGKPSCPSSVLGHQP
jgi:hypothetical protein